MGNRAVSPVLAMVILAGLVVIVGISVLVVGLAVLGGAQSTAETTQAETSMAEFADTANEVAEGSAQTGSFALSGPDGATSWVNESAGRLEIVLVENGTSTTITNGSLGVYKYQTDVGTELSFQGGGVWRYEDGSTVMVEPPAFEYRGGDTPTLEFPHVRVTGETVETGSVDGDLTLAEKNSLVDDIERPITGDYLYADVQSQYCEGWESYMDEQTDGKIEESCTDDVATDSPNELRVNLSVADEYYNTSVNSTPPDDDDDTDDSVNATYGVFAEGDVVLNNSGMDINASVGATGEIHEGPMFSGNKDGQWTENLTLDKEPHDDAIQNHVANGSGWETLCEGQASNCEYQGGQTVYIDQVPPSRQDVTFNVSDGDVTLVVDDTLHLRGEWVVEGYEEGGAVEVYVSDDVAFNNYFEGGTRENLGLSGMTDPLSQSPDEYHPEALTFYGTSNASVEVTDSTSVNLEGTISAPSDQPADKSRVFGAAFSGLTLVGSIHAGQIDFEQMGGDIYQPRSVGTEDEGDEDDDDDDSESGGTEREREYEDPDTDVYFVHVSETVLEVDD